MHAPQSAPGRILSDAMDKSQKLLTQLQAERAELQRDGLSADLDIVQGQAALDDVIDAVQKISQALHKA